MRQKHTYSVRTKKRKEEPIRTQTAINVQTNKSVQKRK